MNVKYVRSLPINPCKGFYKLRSTGITAQEQFLLDFIKDNKVNDVAYVVNNETVTATHNMVVLVQKDPIDIDVLINRIKELSVLAEKYLYVAVNKFCVSSSIDRSIDVDNIDYDQKLVDFIEQSVNRNAIYKFWDTNDSGLLGNFEFPLTQLLFKNE